MTVEETLPFPPDEYMTLVCGRRPAPELRNHFREVGLRLVGTLDQQRMLGEDIRLLDIGCGCWSSGAISSGETAGLLCGI